MRRHPAHTGEEVVEPAVDVALLHHLSAHDAVDQVRQLDHATAHARAVVVQVDPVGRQPEQEADEDDPHQVSGDRLATRDDEVDQCQGEGEPQHDVVEELLRGDGDEDEPVWDPVLAQRVVGDDPAAHAAGGQDVAHGLAAERDGQHLGAAQSDVEHAEDEAEQSGVRQSRQHLEDDGDAEQPVVGTREQRQRLLRVDEPRQQQVEGRDDDHEDDDMAQGLLDRRAPQ